MARRKLGRRTDNRTALLRNLATDMIAYERIETTEERAKELRKLVDKLVTLGKRDNLHARRQAESILFKRNLDEEGISWTVLGTLGTIVLMYAHYNKGMPLKPRSLLYPIFGEKIMKNSAFGTFVDVFSIISVAAGTIGPIGFLGLQAGYGVSTLTGIEE